MRIPLRSVAAGDVILSCEFLARSPRSACGESIVVSFLYLGKTPAVQWVKNNGINYLKKFIFGPVRVNYTLSNGAGSVFFVIVVR